MREPQYFPGLLWKALRKGAALSLLGDKQELLDTRQLIDSAGWKQFQSGGGGSIGGRIPNFASRAFDKNENAYTQVKHSYSDVLTSVLMKQ